MKFTTVYIGENKIELYNNILGKETVKVNGEVVSTKYSIFGAEHLFSIYDGEEESECLLKTGFGLNGVVIDLYHNNKPIIESPKSGCVNIIIGLVIIFIIIGFLKMIFS